MLCIDPDQPTIVISTNEGSKNKVVGRKEIGLLFIFTSYYLCNYLFAIKRTITSDETKRSFLTIYC